MSGRQPYFVVRFFLGQSNRVVPALSSSNPGPPIFIMDINSLIEHYGLPTAVLLAVGYGLYRLFENVFPGAFERWQKDREDNREFSQSMDERLHDLRTQLLTIDAGRQAEADHRAFEIIDRLLDEKQNQVSEIQRALQEITVIVAGLQKDQQDHNRRYEERLKNIGENLRQVWGFLAQLREDIKRE